METAMSRDSALLARRETADKRGAVHLFFCLDHNRLQLRDLFAQLAKSDAPAIGVNAADQIIFIELAIGQGVVDGRAGPFYIHRFSSQRIVDGFAYFQIGGEIQ